MWMIEKEVTDFAPVVAGDKVKILGHECEVIFATDDSDVVYVRSLDNKIMWRAEMNEDNQTMKVVEDRVGGIFLSSTNKSTTLYGEMSVEAGRICAVKSTIAKAPVAVGDEVKAIHGTAPYRVVHIGKQDGAVVMDWMGQTVVKRRNETFNGLIWEE